MVRSGSVVLIFGGFMAAVAAALYPIYYHPMAHIEQYKKEQVVNRAGVIQDDVQPPGLKVWSDPFSRK
ncbi:small integral membrane protein 20-like [Bufo gargarizans]|uniref:small integral membrane protein 20-like n=1 Tax=Bufo gargarizans TaxID=30331 RepID=UPI001CF1CC8B|nr:small integral membrane protein 20-like [Bufo gargarizans]XP_044152541.1 small integral membrane protein 20-like [Bufo gargarizans]